MKVTDSLQSTVMGAEDDVLAISNILFIADDENSNFINSQSVVPLVVFFRNCNDVNHKISQMNLMQDITGIEENF
jgi:hypothetical protein